MYAALYLPAMPLQAILRHLPDKQTSSPAVLLDAAGFLSEQDRGKSPIWLRNQASVEAGVEAGMTASQGLARCPQLGIYTREPEREAIADTILLQVAGNLSPQLEATSPGLVMADLEGSPHLRDGLEALGQATLQSLKTCSLTGQFGAAPTPDLAELVARVATPIQVLARNPSAIESFLRPLPTDILELPRDTSAILRLWGIHNLGQLMDLPREEVAERLGAEAVAWQTRLCTNHCRPLRWIEAPTTYAESAELEYEADTLEPILFLLRRFLDQLTARLETAYFVAGKLLLGLSFADQSKHERHFRVPEPTNDCEVLFRILFIHLETLRAPSPVIAVRLEAVPTKPGRCQRDLFTPGLRDPNRFAETLAQLEALLGSDRVGVPRLLSLHKPDAITLEAFHEPNPHQSTYSHLPPFGLSLRRFRPAQAVGVECLAGQPECVVLDGMSVWIEECHGPYRHSGQWWAPPGWARREWDIRLSDGSLYRLIKTQHGWALEGEYD